jgi:hypothetical protein
MRRLYHGFPLNRVKVHESVSKIIGDERPTFKQPDHPKKYASSRMTLSISAALEPTLLGLFGLGSSTNA